MTGGDLGPRKFGVLYIFIAVWGPESGLHGSETRFVRTVDAYRALGADVVTVERSPAMSHGTGASRQQSAEVRVHTSRVNRFPLDVLSVISAVRKGAALARRSRPDVILCGDRNWVNLFPTYLLSLILSRPYGVVVHHVDEGDLANLRRRQAYSGPWGFVRGFAVAVLHEMNYAIGRRASLLIAVSGATAGEFSSTWKISRDKFLVSGCGLGRQVRAHPSRRQVDAIYAGTFLPYKGPQLLPRIWQQVLAARPGARLVIAGGYGRQLEELRELVVQMGLEGSIQVLGYVSDEELSKLYSSSKVFLLPSTKEGFSMATAEAASAGCACVISDIPALREIFGRGAVLVSPGDIDGFAREVVSLLENDGRRERCSAKMKALAAGFTWESVGAAELRALKTLVGRGKKRAV
ncbi:MAG: glycosyltransferase family 4 protein [Nitrososphaerota archaeon]|nr:glycosyltransferase family 4 protein [Nitrososphaerota archaeon]